MRSEPMITVTCDRCEIEEIEVGLTTTACGYDERNIENGLEAVGWRNTGGKDLCPDCLKATAKVADDPEDEDWAKQDLPRR